MGRRRFAGAVAATAAVAAVGLSASANAATFCVQKPSCVAAPTNGTPEATLQDALDAAETNGTGTGSRDFIQIGPVSLTESAVAAPANTVTITGSGRGQTTRTGLGTPSSIALTLQDVNSLVTDLTIRAGAASGAVGLELEGDADRVNVSAAPTVAGSQVG